MKYSLSDFISEVELSINKLRDLARGEEVKFSVFLGAGGVIFQNTGVIDFSDCVLRPINSLVNPGQNIQLVVSTYNTESGNLLAGGIVEVIYTIKANQSAQFTNYISSKELGEYCQRCLEKLKFSLCFALNEGYAFISTFEENGFPLISPGNYSYSPFRGIQKNITIRNSNIVELKGWYQSLSRIGSDIKYIQIPLKRLNYAIHERTNPEDAIIDAIIAWEALFSDAPETSFKVTGSIAKFLKSGNEVPIFFKELNDLYTLRSSIVHGKENKKLNYSDLNAVRSDVVRIGLECLKKLINNIELLKMSPSERCKKILVYS